MHSPPQHTALVWPPGLAVVRLTLRPLDFVFLELLFLLLLQRLPGSRHWSDCLHFLLTHFFEQHCRSLPHIWPRHLHFAHFPVTHFLVQQSRSLTQRLRIAFPHLLSLLHLEHTLVIQSRLVWHAAPLGFRSVVFLPPWNTY